MTRRLPELILVEPIDQNLLRKAARVPCEVAIYRAKISVADVVEGCAREGCVGVGGAPLGIARVLQLLPIVHLQPRRRLLWVRPSDEHICIRPDGRVRIDTAEGCGPGDVEL